ncbi:MAG: hypothetical protein P8129_08105, partial [Anaerolineae bacterium]
MSKLESLPMAVGVRFCLEKLVALLAHREPVGLASEALSSLIADFGATAGSLYYGARPPLHIRRGSLSPQVAAQIDRWESSIAERLAAGPWEIDEQKALTLASQPIKGSDWVAL